MDQTWEGFRGWVSTTAVKKLHYLYRGQSNSEWNLVSTWHRLAEKGDLQSYYDLLPYLHDQVSVFAGKTWNLNDQVELAAFMGFLQHHGFPTPLLDWTRSPYMAAYFAFEGVLDGEPQSDHVSVFIFDPVTFQTDWTQVYDLRSDVAHVSVLTPSAKGNPKQIVQQGTYTFSNVHDQKIHISGLEERYRDEKGADRVYLLEHRFSIKEKPVAMRELRMMGINAMTLFPGSIEAVCKGLREEAFAVERMGETLSERITKFLKSLGEKGEAHPANPANAEKPKGLLE
jgi:hypothetical protein